MDYGGGYNTTYGAAGDTNGGGFVGGEPQSSPAQGRGGYGKDTVRPVTILQILNASQPHPDADFKVDGEAISQITFIGQVRSIQQQTTNITYKVDDGTGIVEVKQWIDTDSTNNANGFKDGDGMDMDDNKHGGGEKKKITEDIYVRVWGRLKAFNNKRHVGAHVIRPIADYNEINYHLLEAAAVHLFFTRGPPQGQGQGSKAGAGGQGMGAVNGADGGNSNLAGLSATARRVLQGLKQGNSNEGLHVHHLATNLGMQVNEVHKGAEELLGHGVIFTTVDDYTWAVLDEA